MTASQNLHRVGDRLSTSRQRRCHAHQELPGDERGRPSRAVIHIRSAGIQHPEPTSGWRANGEERHLVEITEMAGIDRALPADGPSCLGEMGSKESQSRDDAR